MKGLNNRILKERALKFQNNVKNIDFFSEIISNERITAYDIKDFCSNNGGYKSRDQNTR